MAKRAPWELRGKDAFNGVDYENGTMNARQVAPRAWQFLECIDLHSATGETTGARYAVEIKYVDLSALPPETIASVIQSCGRSERIGGEWIQVTQYEDRELAEMCAQYGASAPIASEAGSNRRETMRAGYRAANEALDPDALEEMLARPVNAIGSTAAEFMRGDIDSAIKRGLASGNRDAQIFAKMQDAATIDCPACYGADPECPTCKGRGKVVQTFGGLQPAR
jgi:hypothetical protein